MQIPPTIPKPAAPGPQDLKPEPVARIAPVVMNDAGARIDPSVILKTPVPVSQGPRVATNVRPATDQTGTIYTSPEIAPDTEAAAHIATLMSQLGKADSGTQVLRWPLPREVLQQQQQEPPLGCVLQEVGFLVRVQFQVLLKMHRLLSFQLSFASFSVMKSLNVSIMLFLAIRLLLYHIHMHLPVQHQLGLV